MRSAPRSSRARRTRRSRLPGLQRHRGRQAAGQHDRPGLDALAPGRERLASQTSAAAGWPITAPPAAVSIAPGTGRRSRGRRGRPARPAARPRAPRTTRAAPALSATESGSRKRLGVARVHDLDGGEHRLGRRQHPATVVGASIRLPIRNAISGSARGWMSSSSCSGSPGGTTMPDVSRPNTGSWMPSAWRLTRLVSPSFAPMTARRPAGGARRTATAPCRPSRREERVRCRVNGGDRAYASASRPR